MKIFVTGASGLVGSAFVRIAASAGHEIVGAIGGYASLVPGLAKQLRLDLADAASSAKAIEAERAAAIVNCAAVSAPEACDADPQLSGALNVELPRMLARLAQDTGVRLVHLSSEQVFDGRRTTPYRTGDAPAPLNLYARQKITSEQAVHAIAPELALTLRAPLLMGNSLTGKRSVHERLLLDWMAGRVPKLFTDEFRQTCTADNLAHAMLELCARRDPCGVFHWAGAELISRHALGCAIREHFMLTATAAPIVAATYDDAPGARERRQPCLALELAPLTALLKTQPQTLREQLAELRVPEPCTAWYGTKRDDGARSP